MSATSTDRLRRRFLLAAGGAVLLPRARLALATGPQRRVVVLGAGWGGLAAARALRRQLPDAEVVVVDRAARFFSLPQSTAWLVGRDDHGPPEHDLAAAARRGGYRFVQSEVTSVDRRRRTVATSAGMLRYDWLVVAPGIREDTLPWVDGDPEAAAHLARDFSAGFADADGARALKARLEAFAGGEVVVSIPAGPARCPPAPYERVLALAWWFGQRRLKTTITVLDAGGGIAGFRQAFEDQFPETIRFMPRTAIRRVDPASRRVLTDFDELRFDQALLAAPQRAGALAGMLGLLAPGADGRDGHWAAVEPLTLRSRADERVFVVGDAAGEASPLFGHYPKTGHMAARQGAIAAAAIAAAARGDEAEPTLPDSVCFVHHSLEPPELTRIATRYRIRGDGEIVQEVDQRRINQPRGEAQAWAREMLRDALGLL
ncbi:MAG: NAD(P)/FAD-dependent oxidoreductase [Rhodocyclaceae bacterium]|nr:NAD(P)/FAD-dependent oxidoreductase [Rhodocyclaceae bacterium]